MENQLATSEEFQILKKHLYGEVRKLHKILGQDHTPLYRRLIEKKIQLLGESLETIHRNPGMKLYELCYMIEDRIDSEGREIDDALTFEEKESIYHSISALEWIFNVVKSVLQKFRL